MPREILIGRLRALPGHGAIEPELARLEALPVIRAERGELSIKRRFLRNLVAHYEATAEPEEASKYRELWIAAGGKID